MFAILWCDTVSSSHSDKKNMFNLTRRMRWNYCLGSANKMSSVLLMELLLLCAFLSSYGVDSGDYMCKPGDISSGSANCSMQGLEHIPPNLPHNIHILDLSNNKIQSLMDNSFVKYETLQILHLRNNSLMEISYRAFARLSTLLYLDLSSNSLITIPSNILADMPSLLSLYLNGNRINAVPKEAFKNVSLLKNLYLNGNHIEFIHPKAFYGLQRLQRLELQNNALSELDPKIVQYFTTELKIFKAYNNPWYCDCDLRWLLEWMYNSSQDKNQLLEWKFRRNEPVCTGPSIVKNRPFSSLTTDTFMCRITMYSIGRTFIVEKGKEAELFCKYLADPAVPPTWLKDGKILQISKTSTKYKLTSDGQTMLSNTLKIHNFQYEDIGEYQCHAQNDLGPAYISFLVTLEGVDPASLSVTPAESQEDDNDTQKAIIASSVIGGVVFILVIVGLLIFCIIRCKKYRHKRNETIRMTFEEHLKANGIIEPKSPKVDNSEYDEMPDGTISMDPDMDEQESMYDSIHRPRVPSSTNTNTYISFKTEFSEPDDLAQIYAQRHQNHSNKGSDGSQCESTSPLLDNISPILGDMQEPFYETSLYMPKLIPKQHLFPNNYLNSTSTYEPFAQHRTQTLPIGSSLPYSSSSTTGTPNIFRNGTVPNHRCASVGNLGMVPPKKPPRLFHSRDSMSLSQCSQGSRNPDKDCPGLKLSLPKPGSVDQYGTAV